MKEFASKYADAETVTPSKVNPWLRNLIADFAVKPEELQVLDWGCGKGALMLGLKEMGCNLSGTELDAAHVEELTKTFGEDQVKLITQNNQTDFPDSRFDLVLFHHVFEHVQRPSELLNEVQRIIKPTGVCASTFPAWGRFFEPHTKIPMAHYFPKSSFSRRLMVSLAVTFRMHAIWADFPDEKSKRKAVFNAYLDQKTNYHSIRDWQRMANERGFETQLATHKSGFIMALQRRYPSFMSVMMAPMCFLIQRFWIVHIELRPHSGD